MSELALIDRTVADSAPPIRLPTQDELPCEDGIPMETERHFLQMGLLLETVQPWLAQRGSGYAGGDMFLYFSPAQIRGEYFCGPDVFVALDVPRGERKSWVVWQEGKGPDVVIELLSESTGNYDKTVKKRIYHDQVHVPEYYWYDPFDPDDWAGFRSDGVDYQPLPRDVLGRMFSPQLQLFLLRWHGVYRGVETVWLRWATLDGELLLTGFEHADRERQIADQAQQRADQVQQWAEQAQERAQQQTLRAQQQTLRAQQAEEMLLTAQQRIAELEARLAMSGQNSTPS